MRTADLASVMIVTSGAAHAVVSAIFKSGRDKMSSRALIDGFSAVIMLPAAFFVPLPEGAWHWLLASWATHLVYLYCMIRSFEVTDMSVAYPIARGVAPALAATVAVAIFREHITWPIGAGIGLVSTGVITVGAGKHAAPKALAWACATGVSIALYTVLDAQGVRAAPSAGSYIVWCYLTLGGGIGLAFALWRGPAFLVNARTEWRAGLAAGVLSIVSYSLALAAYRMGGTPRLAALREISILFGVAIAVLVLKERMTAGRVIGVGAIAAGAATLLAAR